MLSFQCPTESNKAENLCSSWHSCITARKGKSKIENGKKREARDNEPPKHQTSKLVVVIIISAFNSMNMNVRLRSLFLSNSFSIPLCSSFSFSITMWQVLLAVAVAASTGFITNHFLKHSTDHTDDPGTPLEENPISYPPVVPDASEIQDGIFRFSSLELRKDGFPSRPNDSTKKPFIGRQRSKHGIRIAKGMQRSDEELRSRQSKDGNQLSFCLKRRKMIKNRIGSAGFCSSKGQIIVFLFLWLHTYIYILLLGKITVASVEIVLLCDSDWLKIFCFQVNPNICAEALNP